MKRVELLSSGELILVPGLWSDEARLQGTRGGPGAQADVAWGGAQGARAAGPDRDTEQGSLPALGHPLLGRALRAADAVPEAVPFPHFEDHAGGASRSGGPRSVHKGGVRTLLGGGRGSKEL